MIDGFHCEDKETLVSYAYGEIELERRREVEAHLLSCALCQGELAGFVDVRGELLRWAPPDTEMDLTLLRKSARKPTMWTMWWGERSVPAWAGVAAAVLILATGAAIANVQLRFSDGEVTLSTGWRSTSAITNSPETAARPDVALAPLSAAEWRQAIAQVEAELRTEIDAVRRSNTSVPSSAVLPSPDAALLRRIQSLITESEQRQREELALRFTQFTRDVEVQRRTDLVRIEQGFGQVEGRAGAEAARQRQLLNYLVRVSGQPPQ